MWASLVTCVPVCGMDAPTYLCAGVVGAPDVPGHPRALGFTWGGRGSCRCGGRRFAPGFPGETRPAVFRAAGPLNRTASPGGPSLLPVRIPSCVTRIGAWSPPQVRFLPTVLDLPPPPGPPVPSQGPPFFPSLVRYLERPRAKRAT